MSDLQKSPFTDGDSRLSGNGALNIESTVINTLRRNNLSSAAVISFMTNIPEIHVQEVITRLLFTRKIYQSVRGVPKRYSIKDF